MIARSLLAALAATALFFSLAVSALAWSGEVEGSPTLAPESPEGYYIWHDEQGIHLRTHSPGAAHLFTARLTTDGIFKNVNAVRLESHDDIAVVDGGHTLLLRLHTYDHIDGVDFTIAGGSKLRFALRLGGALISTDSIYLGPAGEHPDSNPFVIHR